MLVGRSYSRDSISFPLFGLHAPLSSLPIHKGRQDLSGMTINNSEGERDILLFSPRVIKRIPRRHCRRRCGSFFPSNGSKAEKTCLDIIQTSLSVHMVRRATKKRGERRDARRKNAHHLFSLHIPPLPLSFPFFLLMELAVDQIKRRTFD